MEGHEKIKQLTLEEIQKIDPKNIAYMTLVGGDVVVVNGLDHEEFNKKEKEYLKQSLKSQNPKKSVTNTPSNLQKIQETSEENERNSNQVNNEVSNLIIRPSNIKFPDENPNDAIPELIYPINSNGSNSEPQPFNSCNNKNSNYVQISNPSINLKNNNINYNRGNKYFLTENNNIRGGNIKQANNHVIKQSYGFKVNKRYKTDQLINNNNYMEKELGPRNFPVKNNYSNFGTFIDPNNNSVIFSVRPRQNIINNYNTRNEPNPFQSSDQIARRFNSSNYLPNNCYFRNKRSVNNSFREIKYCKKNFDK